MKTLFSTLLLAFAVLTMSCGSKAAKAAEETAAAPETEIVAQKDDCTCNCEEGKCTKGEDGKCTDEKCTKTEDGKCACEKCSKEEADKKAE